MSMLRRLSATLLIVLLATWLMHRYVVTPYRMNVTKKTVNRRTAIASSLPPGATVARMALLNVSALQPFEESPEADAELFVLKAANERFLNTPLAAISSYRKALEREQRPEIYFYLGLTELDTGQHRQGVLDLARAIRFAPSMARELPPDVADEVVREATVPSS